MGAANEPALLRRLVEFQLTLERDASNRVERFDWGWLLSNQETGDIWVANFLEVDSAEHGADQLADAADELLGSRGMHHRYVVPSDPENGERLAPRFRELGWEVDRSLYMVLDEPATRDHSTAEVSREAASPVRRAVAEADPDFTRTAGEQLPIRDARLDEVSNGRWFAAPANGAPGAACVLYEHDGIGQVETVGTKPELRGRGLATAVVLAAADASRRAGHELTFIVADASDWPWKLYERIGFEPLGESAAFLRKPNPR
jgi:ribosomal protein S18 acetylase RimI-like enzyme